MTGWEWLFVLAIVSGWTVLIVWVKRRTRETLAKADQQTQRMFERRRTLLSGIGSLAMGAVFVAAMLVTWPTAPAENEPFGVTFIAFGFAAILYGTYKLYGLRR